MRRNSTTLGLSSRIRRSDRAVPLGREVSHDARHERALPPARPEALELLQAPPRRRPVLRRLRRAAHLPAVPQDGARADASRRSTSRRGSPRATTGRRCSTRTAPSWRRTTRAAQRLGTEPGMLGLIFRKAQNRIQDPAKLRRLIVDLIDPRPGPASTPTSRATPTRVCWRRTPPTPSPARASTSRRGR